MAVVSPKSELLALTEMHRFKLGCTNTSEDPKRKASDEPASPDSQEQANKKARTDSPEKKVSGQGFIWGLERSDTVSIGRWPAAESPAANSTVPREGEQPDLHFFLTMRAPRTITDDDDPQPAVLEERRGDIEFRVVNNDGSHDSFIVLTGLKCIFQKQLPKMPKDYIARLVYDRSHLSIAIVKHPLEVVGYESWTTRCCSGEG